MKVVLVKEVISCDVSPVAMFTYLELFYLFLIGPISPVLKMLEGFVPVLL